MFVCSTNTYAQPPVDLGQKALQKRAKIDSYLDSMSLENKNVRLLRSMECRLIYEMDSIRLIMQSTYYRIDARLATTYQQIPDNFSEFRKPLAERRDSFNVKAKDILLAGLLNQKLVDVFENVYDEEGYVTMIEQKVANLDRLHKDIFAQHAAMVDYETNVYEMSQDMLRAFYDGVAPPDNLVFYRQRYAQTEKTFEQEKVGLVKGKIHDLLNNLLGDKNLKKYASAYVDVQKLRKKIAELQAKKEAILLEWDNTDPKQKLNPERLRSVREKKDVLNKNILEKTKELKVCIKVLSDWQTMQMKAVFRPFPSATEELCKDCEKKKKLYHAKDPSSNPVIEKQLEKIREAEEKIRKEEEKKESKKPDKNGKLPK